MWVYSGVKRPGTKSLHVLYGGYGGVGSMQCPSCSKEVEEHSTFCTHCGTRVKERQVSIAIDTSRPDRLTAGAGALLFFISAFLPIVKVPKGLSEMGMPVRPEGALFWLILLITVAVGVASLVPTIPFQRYLGHALLVFGGMGLASVIDAGMLIGAIDKMVSAISFGASESTFSAGAGVWISGVASVLYIVAGVLRPAGEGG